MKKYLALVLGLGVAAIAAAACSGGTTGGSTASPTPSNNPGTSIHDVQTGVVATNSTVTLNNVIVTATNIGTHNNFWAQDAGGGQYSGVYFYDKNNVVDPSIAIGDTVNVTGAVQNFYGDLEINVSSYTKVSSGATPTMDSVSINNLDDTSASQSRAWNGCLVSITGANVTTVGLGFGEFGVGTALGTPQYPLHVGNAIHDVFEHAIVGQTVTTLQGVIDYNYDFKVLPRSDADFVTTGGPSTAVQTFTSIAGIRSAITGSTVTSGQLVEIDNASGTIVVTGTAGKLNTKTNAYRVNFWAQDTTGTTGIGMEFEDSFYRNPANLAPGSKITGATGSKLVGKLINYTSKATTQGWSIQFGFNKDTTDTFGPTIATGTAPTPAGLTDVTKVTTAYEGQLVKVPSTGTLGVVCDATNAQYKEYSVGPTGCASKLWISSVMADTSPNRAAGNAISSVTGIVYNSHYLYVAPRKTADVQ